MRQRFGAGQALVGIYIYKQVGALLIARHLRFRVVGKEEMRQFLVALPALIHQQALGLLRAFAGFGYQVTRLGGFGDAPVNAAVEPLVVFGFNQRHAVQIGDQLAAFFLHALVIHVMRRVTAQNVTVGDPALLVLFNLGLLQDGKTDALRSIQRG